MTEAEEVFTYSMLRSNHTINAVSGRRSQPTATRNGNELSEQQTDAKQLSEINALPAKL